MKCKKCRRIVRDSGRKTKHLITKEQRKKEKAMAKAIVERVFADPEATPF
jgi:hypothetical protein